MGENNLGNHPFGENPFGEGVIVDSSFGNPMSGGGNGSEEEGSNEKVCPHCGTAMVGIVSSDVWKRLTKEKGSDEP